MNRAEQYRKWDEVAALYHDGVPVREIMRQTLYTRAMIYRILQKRCVKVDRISYAQKMKDDHLVLIPYFGAKPATVARKVFYAQTLDQRPALMPQFRKLGITEQMMLDLDYVLRPLGLFLTHTPTPRLTTIIQRKFFPLTWVETLHLYANPTEFLRTHAPAIKAGWSTPTQDEA
jgi:hypothetical protein